MRQATNQYQQDQRLWQANIRVCGRGGGYAGVSSSHTSAQHSDCSVVLGTVFSPVDAHVGRQLRVTHTIFFRTSKIKRETKMVWHAGKYLATQHRARVRSIRNSTHSFVLLDRKRRSPYYLVPNSPGVHPHIVSTSLVFEFNRTGFTSSSSRVVVDHSIFPQQGDLKFFVCKFSCLIAHLASIT